MNIHKTCFLSTLISAKVPVRALGISVIGSPFNLLLKRVRPKLNSEEAILEHYLKSLEGVLQFTLRDRSPSTLEEAQDLAYQIERNLEFEEYISVRSTSHAIMTFGTPVRLWSLNLNPWMFLKLNSPLLKGNWVFPIPMCRISLFMKILQNLKLARIRRRKSKYHYLRPLSIAFPKKPLSLSTK